MLILILLSLLIWRHIPNLMFVGEGYTYFEPTVTKIIFSSSIPHDFLAKILFNILPSIFQEKVGLYMWFLFLIMIAINIIFYLIIKSVTKSKLTGFLSGLLLTASYTANFDMYSSGGYQYFVQRGILLVFLLPAFYFLVLYFTSKFLIKYYLFSLLFYILGLFSGFFSTWFLPVFIFYPLFYLVLNFKSVKNFPIKIIWTPLPFIISNFLIIRQSSFIPSEESLLGFIFNNFTSSIIGILQQLTIMTFPLGELLKTIDKNSPQFLAILGLVAMLYLSILIISLKIKNNNKVLQLTAAFSLILMLLFNIYLNSANVLVSFGSSRYFYYPFVMLAIFWGIFFSAIFAGKKLMLGLFCLVWIVINMMAIKENLAGDEFLHRANRQTLEFLDNHASNLRQYPSVIHLPGIGPYGAAFVSRYYNHPDGKLILQGLENLDLEKLAEDKVNPDRLFVLYFDSVSQLVVDKTEESRKILKDLENDK